MKFEVEVSKEWTESGCVTIDADSEEEARDVAEEMLSEGSEEIEWEGSNMSPGNQCVEGVMKVK